MSNTFDHGYALLIGVGDCAYAPWSLPVTVRDVQAVQQVLTDPDYCAYPAQPDHLRLLTAAGATRQAILSGLAWLAQQTANDPQATALIYFSGHGWLDETTGRDYLIPHDVSPGDVTGSALAAETFIAAIRRLSAARLLICMDCCHAAGMATAKAPLVLPAALAPHALPKTVSTALCVGQGRAVVSACREHQQSWVRPDQTLSLFTHHLVEALQGAGNQPGDRLVYLSNLMNYLGRTVPASARQLCQQEQTPFFETASEDFPIALIQGGRSAAPAGETPTPPPGNRNVVIGGDLRGGIIITGDQNRVERDPP
jgi:uncharacterized caspase-like protein